MTQQEQAPNSDIAETRDNFESAFNYFVRALEVLSHDPEMQCDEMGNYNTPYEIQRDVAGGGLGILRISAAYLEWEHAEAILDLVAAIRRLPPEAIVVPHVSMTRREGCLIAMNHPAWSTLRTGAGKLLELLNPVIERNRAYFASPGYP
ncbi:hypothetical protein ABIE56_003477 [Luteibacter sp. 621]|uniref:hypothetical protein n=1 Tax=Luteibacter sp. 621 TaxID=3373916 RepID=UPI003D1BE54F